jgi:hypothetical protein
MSTELDLIDSLQADSRVVLGIVHTAAAAMEHPGEIVPQTIAPALRHVETTLEHMMATVKQLDGHRKKRHGVK